MKVKVLLCLQGPHDLPPPLSLISHSSCISFRSPCFNLFQPYWLLRCSSNPQCMPPLQSGFLPQPLLSRNLQDLVDSQVAIAKFHRLDGLNKQKFLSPSSGGRKGQDQGQAGFGFWCGSPSLLVDSYLLAMSFTWPFLYACT